MNLCLFYNHGLCFQKWGMLQARLLVHVNLMVGQIERDAVDESAQGLSKCLLEIEF